MRDARRAVVATDRWFAARTGSRGTTTLYRLEMLALTSAILFLSHLTSSPRRQMGEPVTAGFSHVPAGDITRRFDWSLICLDLLLKEEAYRRAIPISVNTAQTVVFKVKFEVPR